MRSRSMGLMVSSFAIVTAVAFVPPEFRFLDPWLGTFLAHLVLMLACALAHLERVSIFMNLAYAFANGIAMHDLMYNGLTSFAWSSGFLTAFVFREAYARVTTMNASDVAIVAAAFLPIVGLNAIVRSMSMIQVATIYQIATYATLLLRNGQ